MASDCKHMNMTVAELEADGYVMDDMPLCEMCSFDTIERLEAKCKYKDEVIDQRNAMLTREENKVKRLREALEKYGSHLDSCNCIHHPPYCDCGYIKLLWSDDNGK